MILYHASIHICDIYYVAPPQQGGYMAGRGDFGGRGGPMGGRGDGGRGGYQPQGRGTYMIENN